MGTPILQPSARNHTRLKRFAHPQVGNLSSWFSRKHETEMNSKKMQSSRFSEPQCSVSCFTEFYLLLSPYQSYYTKLFYYLSLLFVGMHEVMRTVYYLSS